MSMEGLYLYCIKEKSGSPIGLSSKAIDGKGEVFVFGYRELEAVVSSIPLEEFTSQEIQNKARENLGWIKEKAVQHETVMEELANGGANLLPMRFGVIFRERTNIEATLEKNYYKIKNALDRIRGKQEWSVKVYLKSSKDFEQALKANDDTIRKKEKAIAEAPEGVAFFLEQELKEILARAMDRELSNVANLVFTSLERKAHAAKKCKILTKELTNRNDTMTLNAAFLIAGERVEDFRKEAEAVERTIRDRGFCLEYCGPWPNYNFSDYE